eukprot:gene11522-24098_t
MKVTCNQRTNATALLCLVTIFIFADQNLLAPNMSEVAQEFEFSDREKDWKLGGELAFGFFLLGAPAALLVGLLSDTMNRCVLFAITIALGEISCLLIYWSKTYLQLFILRTLTGISIGGAGPIIFSLLADFYSGPERIHVATLVSVSMSLGIAGGQVFAGLIGPDYGWRLPFLLTPIPSLLCSVLFVLTTTEPNRGSQENYSVPLRSSSGDSDSIPMAQAKILQDSPEYKEQINCEKLGVLLRTPTVLMTYLQGIPGCVPWGIIYVFLNDFLSANRGFSVAGATAVLFAFGVGSFVGQLLGGWAGQYIYNRNKGGQCVFIGLSSMCGVFPFIYIINGPVDERSIPWFFVVAFLGGCLVSITGPNVRSILQNVSSPETRGTAFAFFNLTDDVGKGGGPVLVAALIHMCGSRERAFNIGICLWFFCGAVLCMMAFTVTRDETAVQDRYRSALEQQTAVAAASGNGDGCTSTAMKYSNHKDGYIAACTGLSPCVGNPIHSLV